MPFIDSKVSVSISEEKRDIIKTKLGEAITILGKSESWLMVGFEDNYCLYFKGDQNAPTAIVEIKLFGKASSDAYNKMTASVCQIFNSELGIPSDRIYVKYEEVANWGYNGFNF